MTFNTRSVDALGIENQRLEQKLALDANVISRVRRALKTPGGVGLVEHANKVVLDRDYFETELTLARSALAVAEADLKCFRASLSPMNEACPHRLDAEAEARQARANLAEVAAAFDVDVSTLLLSVKQ